MRKEEKVHKCIRYTLFMVYGAIFDVDMKVLYAYYTYRQRDEAHVNVCIYSKHFSVNLK